MSTRAKAPPRGNKPKVIIVGAGLGGITLGILLEKAGIKFQIFERAPIVKPLGSAISLGASILTFFEQIGILEEFLSHGKPTITASMYNEKRELQNEIDFSFLKEFGGHYNYIVSRPLLYDLMLRQIPAQRLHFGKRVLSISQGEHGVLIRTSDGQTHEGDILVGADGAYSAVRQSLQHLDAGSSKTNDAFRNSEWGPEAAEQMCNEVRDFAIPGGDGNLTMADLIDNTPKHLISKVMLEEKMNPAGGMGAINAMQDAIAIANWINVLDRSSTWEETERAFKEYKTERYPWAMGAFRDSQIMSKLVAVNLTGKIARFATKNLPAWAHRMALSRVISYRPQVSFLPLAQDRGANKPTTQRSYIKTKKRLAKKEAVTQKSAQKSALASAV
ncbi:hypothetical protein BGZ82_002631 [Podila clonocystis]|nr:hypothetical protein BGZ82_002631 [Podila clonocystis]